MNNWLNQILLSIFLWPSAWYRKMDVNIPQLRSILTTKLIMDDRRATGLQKIRKRSDKEIDSATLTTVLMALFTGLFLLVAFIIEDDLTRVTFLLFIFGFMLAMFLITDFSYILLDVKDNYIILPKPVSSQTFLVARLLHILIHISKIVVPLALPAWIAMWISRGLWGAGVLLVILVLFTLLTFALVNALYLLIMQLFTPSRINSIITTMQIAFSIIIYGGYQWINTLVGRSYLEQLDFHDYLWLWIFPTFWMAAGWVMGYTFSAEPIHIIGAVLSLLTPLVGIWIMIRFLAPAFFRKLSMISGGTGEVDAKKSKSVDQQSPPVISTIASRLLTRPGLDRATFLFAWRMTGRNRDFKLKVYPQIGYLVVILAIMIFRLGDQLEFNTEGLEIPRVKFIILFVIYLTGMLYVSAIAQLPYHEKFKAAWLYYVPPLRRPGPVYYGTFKALMTKFILIPSIPIFIIGIWLFGLTIIPTFICGFANIFLVSSLFSWFWVEILPFSIEPAKASRNQATFRNLLAFILLPVLATPQYFLFSFPWVLSVWAVLSFGIGWFVLNYTKGVPWEQQRVL